MDVQVIYPQKPPQSQRLNPDAPIFVPMKSYQMVEDFSDQWWDLVHSSPSFRDYWLQDCFDDVDDDEDDIFNDDFFQSDDFFLPDFDAFSDIFLKQEGKMKEEEKKKDEERSKELITMAALKWDGCNGRAKEASRNFEKVPKVVKNVKVSPRTIHQPR